MTSSRIAFSAAIAAVLAWTLKAVAIGTAGGLDKSPFESPLFFAGLLSFLVACVALGVALTDGRPPWVRAIAGAVLAPVVGIGFTILIGSIVRAIRPPEAQHWVWAEIELWVNCATLLALAFVVDRRRRTPARAEQHLAAA